MSMKEQKLEVPIRIELGVHKKKMYYLNLNGYRNWNFQLNNQLKKTFKIEIADKVRALDEVVNPCEIEYKIFYINKREFDLDNIGTVLSKFTNDALVEYDILVDDNYKHVTKIKFVFGGIDKDDPRAEVTIKES